MPVGETEKEFFGPIKVGWQGIHDLHVGSIYHDENDVFIVVRKGGELVPVSIKSLIPSQQAQNSFTPLTLSQKSHGAFCIPVLAENNPTTTILDEQFGGGEGSIGLVRPDNVTNDTSQWDLRLWVRTHGIWTSFRFSELIYPIPDKPTGQTLDEHALPYKKGRVPNISIVETGVGRTSLLTGDNAMPVGKITAGTWGLNKDRTGSRVDYDDTDLWAYPTNQRASFRSETSDGNTAGQETASSPTLNDALPNLPVAYMHLASVELWEDYFGVDEGFIALMIDGQQSKFVAKLGGGWWGIPFNWP